MYSYENTPFLKNVFFMPFSLEIRFSFKEESKIKKKQAYAYRIIHVCHCRNVFDLSEIS